MINRILDLFVARDGAPAGGDGGHDAEELQLAAAALLVEAATMDSHFDASERTKIESLVSERFGLRAEEARSLVETAEQRVADSSQLFGFTKVINQRFDFEERVELMEMLWQVVYADGALHHYEANLMRRLAGLIHVPDRDSGEARKRARARLGLED